jgi:hypothetical protein
MVQTAYLPHLFQENKFEAAAFSRIIVSFTIRDSISKDPSEAIVA